MMVSLWAISFWFAWSIISAWIDLVPLDLNTKNNNDNQSNIIEIQIHIHTKFARLSVSHEDIAVVMDNITSMIHNVNIAHRNGWVSLFWIQKNSNMHHLMNAHSANIHIINVPIKLLSRANTSMNPRINMSIQIINNIVTYCVCWFFIALIIADIQEKIKAIQSNIFIILQKIQGLNTVTNQHMVIIIANHSNNRNDRSFFIMLSIFAKITKILYSNFL